MDTESTLFQTDILTASLNPLEEPILGQANVGAAVPMMDNTDLDLTEASMSPIPQSSGDGVYYVSPSGSDENSGSQDQPWRSINYAVSEDSPINPGDTVLVQPGTYTELISLGKSGSDAQRITLKANGEVTLRDPDPNSGGFPEGVIQSPGQSNWVIDGFRIENTSWAGISLSDAKNITVQNNETYQTGSSGIIVLPKTFFGGGEDEITGSNVKILNNTVERANWKWDGPGDTDGDQEALSIWGVDGFEVANNKMIDGKREGMDIKVGSRNGLIHDNSITSQALISGTYAGFRGGAAIYVDGNRADSFNLDIYNNEIFANTADAILIADEVPNVGDVSDINIYNNVIYGNGRRVENGGVGVAIANNVRDVEIVNNTFANNVQGVNIDNRNSGYNPRDILIRNNIFADNSYQNVFVQDASNVTLDNNLFTNTDEFADKTDLYDGGERVSNFNVFDNELAESVDFVNLEGNDYRLTSTSLAIDIGASISNYAQFDKDGKQRLAGAVDVGAYEL
ncbi:right-handed parallel beta-helix repeat-containing protein [Rivularia sp. UHCC 0363]|uniref:right-handed parallel beta-helix repeat-containing protein n=1 Tax=Rivularia sp. UHCC 0363 TaxID=3110244 RepID=UPI002B1F9FF9|nr:right-handed parallel beta-helix repeat-containing protein [Rivularia sp. UHCC 0363]MEA5593842.1 right-handed parallel beta-helix repeat-containing protein [Rivularia sp. UHCC 0363]